MRSRGKIALGLALVAVATLQSACTSDSAPKAWTTSTTSVVGTQSAPPDSMRMDVYLDATVSMGGYAVAGGEYGRFLEALESTSQTAWKRTAIHYYKFGGSAREIVRQEFLGARTPAFYHEAGLSAVTSIQRAINCHRGPNISVIITDLFQTEGDVNAVVDQVKQQCFQQGVTVGILGIPSRFDGTVYDAKVPSYRYTSSADPASLRPFFALMFGDQAAIERLVSSLSALPFVDRRKFTAIGPTIVASYTVGMSKPRTDRVINLRSQVAPYQFAFDVRKGESGGTVIDTIHVRPREGAMPVRGDQVELIAFKKSAVNGKGARWTDSTATNDFSLTKLDMPNASNSTTATATTTATAATLSTNVSGPSGRYSYMLLLRTGAINGFESPAWIRALSSDNPTPQSDANKTLNLDRFVLALRGAASSVSQPEIAKWYVDVRKQ